jgi:antitoxin CptB
MLSEIEYKKLGWHSRRGMRELDLLLLPFVDGFLRDLSADDQGLYKLLLAEEDQDLYNWLVLRSPAPNESLKKIVKLIRESRVPLD